MTTIFYNEGKIKGAQFANNIKNMNKDTKHVYIEIDNEKKKVYNLICDQNNCASIDPDLKTIYFHSRAKIYKQEINLFL